MKRISAFTLLELRQINSGGKMASFYMMNQLAKRFKFTTYFFEKTNEKGLNMNKKFSLKQLKSKNIPLIKKLHLDFLFRKKELKKIKTDIVYLDFPYLFFIAKIVAKNNNAPIVLIEHNIEWQYHKKNKAKWWFLVKMLETYVVKKSNYTICISKKDYEYWKNKLPQKKIFFFDFGVTNEVFSPNGPKKKLSSKKSFNVLFYGRLNTSQNMEAIKTIKNIKAVTNNNVKFHIFGSGNIKKELVKDFEFYGTVKNPAEYIRSADIIIVPLKNDSGIKIRILESLYCGKVILTTSEVARGIPAKLKPLVTICKTEKEFANKINFLESNRKVLKEKEKKINKTIKEYKVQNELPKLFAKIGDETNE